MKVIEMGLIDFENGKVEGLVIEATRDEIKSLPNLLYKEVKIEEVSK